MNRSAGAAVLNGLGIFVSVILSILFVLTAFVLPVYYAVAGMLQPKMLTSVIQNVDYVEILKVRIIASKPWPITETEVTTISIPYAKESAFWWMNLVPRFSLRQRMSSSRDNRNMKSFEEEMLYDGKSWNEYPFNTSELDGICIHYFMHDIFNHNHTYSLEDLMLMKPENFSWQVNICLEHWGKSVKHKV